MKQFLNYINGKEVAARDGRTSPVIDPVTGKQYAAAALSSAADVDDAMQAAAHAFESWKNTTPSMRQKAINDIADAMEAHMDELIEAEVTAWLGAGRWERSEDRSGTRNGSRPRRRPLRAMSS